MKKIVFFIVAVMTCQIIISGNRFGSFKSFDTHADQKKEIKGSEVSADRLVIPFAFPLSAHPEIMAQIRQKYGKPAAEKEIHAPVPTAASERDVLLDTQIVATATRAEPAESIKTDDKKGSLEKLRKQQKRQFAHQQTPKPTPAAPAPEQEEDPIAQKAKLIASVQKRALKQSV
ncbi:MAG TPA: hypothetical protein VFF04_02395 [Candidatus Babeliales bacterium]|nr:hypothetical protein [Candidatus Babeliales bacterium]